MPALALGTAGLSGVLGALAMEYALRSGYRALDTAIQYGNHDAVGQAIRASGVPREEIFVISKIPPELQGHDRASGAVRQMLEELQSGYMDLCLVHWPSVAGATTDAFVVIERAGTWRALEAAHQRGDCRHIGVSNYMPKHLEELLDYAVVPPAVNQIELHPYQVDAPTLSFCRRHGIAVQSYGSIGTRGLMDDPVVVRVAAEVGRSAGQVLLRWAVQEGTMVLPRSTKEERILENARLWDFELTPQQQARLSGLHQNRRSYDNPTEVPAGSFERKRHWARWRPGRNSTS